MIGCPSCERVFETRHGMHVHHSATHGSRVACAVEGCERPSTSLGLCQAHYRRRERTGDVGPAEIIKHGRVGCTVAGCDRAHQSLGLCATHYQQRWRRGRTTRQIRPYGQRQHLVCSVCGAQPVKARGLCNAHDLQRRRRERRRRQIRGSWWCVVCDFLEARGPMTTAVLVEIIQQRHDDVRPSTVRTDLARLRKAGVVERVDDLWRVVDPDWVERATLA